MMFHIYVYQKKKQTNYLKFQAIDIFKDLLTNKQFSVEVLSGSLIVLDSEYRELV